MFDEFGVLEINHNDDDQSLLLHTNCYNFVKKTLNIALHIKNVPIQNKRVAIDYGAMSIYQGLTFFELDRMISDDNLWILKSPLKIGDHHSKNAERMQSIAAQFVASNAEFI